MDIRICDTYSLYSEMYSLPLEKRSDFFRNILMEPFKEMWETINVPIKSQKPGGYDVVMAAEMLGFLKFDAENSYKESLQILRKNHAWDTALNTLKELDSKIQNSNFNSKLKTLNFGIFLADPEKLKLQMGYTGFGGIPGYIMIIINPNEYNIPRLPAIIAHEFNHNLRFSLFDWDHGNVSLGEYIVSEGLAEAFAVEAYGAKRMGPWATNFNRDDLEYSKEVIMGSLNLKGFGEIASYMFGDAISEKMGYRKVGLSPFAGYAVGYHMVSEYLEKTNQSVLQATLKPSRSILEEVIRRPNFIQKSPKEKPFNK